MYKKTEFYIKYIEPYEYIFEEYSKEIGLKGDNKYVKLAEASSRKASEEIIWDINKNVELDQMNLDCPFDITLYSSHTIQVESKSRGYSIDDFKTTDISVKKGEFIEKRNGWLIVFFYEGYDYLVFDLTTDCFTTGKEWTHKKTSAYKNDEEITEKKYCFYPSKAIYRGRLDNDWRTKGGYGRN